ncbi:MAG: hypothetical protein Q7J48_12000 [Nocardioides sp.]|nr:hypothetical protein [Nocardioides sp.]
MTIIWLAALVLIATGVVVALVGAVVRDRRVVLLGTALALPGVLIVIVSIAR